MMEFKSATSRPHIRNRDSDNMDDSSTRQEKLADYSKSRASFTSTDFAVAMDLDGSSQHSLSRQASIRRLTPAITKASLPVVAGDKELLHAISTTAFLLSLPVEGTSDEARVAHNISLSAIDNSTHSQKSMDKNSRSDIPSAAHVHRRRSLQDKSLSCSDRLRLSLSFRNQSQVVTDNDSSRDNNKPMSVSTTSANRQSSASDPLSLTDLPVKTTSTIKRDRKTPTSPQRAEDVKFNLRRRSFNTATAKRSSLHQSDTNNDTIPVSSTHRLHMSLSSLMIDDKNDEEEGEDEGKDKEEVVPDHRRRICLDESETEAEDDQPLQVRPSLYMEEHIILEGDEEGVPDHTRRPVEKPRVRKVGTSESLAPLPQSSPDEQNNRRQERRARRRQSRGSLSGSSPNLSGTASVALWNAQPKSRTELAGMIQHRNNSLSNSLSNLAVSSSHRRQRLSSNSMRDASASSSTSMLNAQWPSKQSRSTTQLGGSLPLAVPTKQQQSGQNLQRLLRKASRRSSTRLALSAVALAGESSHPISTTNEHTNSQWRAKAKSSVTRTSSNSSSNISSKSYSKLDRLTASFTDMMDASTSDLLSESLHKPSATALQRRKSSSPSGTPRHFQSTGNILLDYMAKKQQHQQPDASLSSSSKSHLQNAQWTSRKTNLPKKGSPSSSMMNARLSKLASLNRSASASAFAQHKTAGKTTGYASTTNLLEPLNATESESRRVSLVRLRERLGSKAANRDASRQTLLINTSGATARCQDNIQALAELKRKLLQSKLASTTASASYTQLGMGTGAATTLGNHNYEWSSQKSTGTSQSKRSMMANPFQAIANQRPSDLETPLASNKRVKALAPDGVTVISRNSSFTSVLEATSATIPAMTATNSAVTGSSGRSTSFSLAQKRLLLDQLGTTITSTSAAAPTSGGVKASLSQSQSHNLLGQLTGSTKSGARSSTCLTQMLSLSQKSRCGSSAANLTTMRATPAKIAGGQRMPRRQSRQNLMSDSITNDPSHFVTGSRIRRYRSSGTQAFPNS